MSKGQTRYSTDVEGNDGNYNYPVAFDYTDGYVGIDQRCGPEIDRVLLTPLQVRELIAFIRRQKRK